MCLICLCRVSVGTDCMFMSGVCRNRLHVYVGRLSEQTACICRASVGTDCMFMSGVCRNRLHVYVGCLSEQTACLCRVSVGTHCIFGCRKKRVNKEAR